MPPAGGEGDLEQGRAFRSFFCRRSKERTKEKSFPPVAAALRASLRSSTVAGVLNVNIDVVFLSNVF
jgi:hypothetical protein